MKPSEIYSLPTLHAQPWHGAPEGLIEAVFNVEIYSGYADVPDWDSSPVMIHTKLETTITASEHWVSIDTFEYEGVPFAVVSCSATDHSGNDYEVLVSDRATYEKARAHVISMVHQKADNALFDESDSDTKWGNLHGAVIARFADGYRLAQRSEVGFGGGEPIFDMKKLQRDHELKIGHFQGGDMEKGLRSERGAALAFEIIGDAILRGRKTMVGKWIGNSDWFAGFYEADGYVYGIHADSYVLSSNAVSWDRHVEIGYLCHGTFYDAMDRYVRTGEADLGDPALVDLKASFGLSDAEALAALGKVVSGEADFTKAAVKLLLARDVVPERFDGIDLDVFAQARVLAEDGTMVRFGLGDMSSVDRAREYWGRYQQAAGHKARQAGSEPSAGYAPFPL